MKPEECNRSKCNIDGITEYEVKVKYRNVPETAGIQQCSNCTECPDCVEPQPEGAESELPEVEVNQAEAPVAVETPPCPNCAKLQLEDVLDLYCSCSPQNGPGQGVPNSPQQVLADYNSRPPILVNSISRRPLNVAVTPINAQPGRPVYTAPQKR